MQPPPASPARGGFPPTASPSVETGESNTFTDSAEEPQLRESDNTTVNAKPADDAYLSPIHLMQAADESSSPLPDGDAGGGDSRTDLTPVPRAAQEYWYTNEGELCSP